MELMDFDYYLPKESIAQEPMRPRDHSRLLCLRLRRPANANAGHAIIGIKIENKHFYNIVDYLNKGDVLVLNNSKVFPARLPGKRKETGGKVEVFLLKKIRANVWQCLIGGQRRKIGLAVDFGRGLEGKVTKDNNDGTWEVRFNQGGKAFMDIVEKIGKTPLPPYIKRTVNKKQTADDRIRYQTVYADDKKAGSVAAPTAGFHFTPKLLNILRSKGVQIEYITLHVGLGTFAPVKVDDIKKHKMHAEYVEVKESVLTRIIKAKQEGRRIIAVGTTSVRTLEAVSMAERGSTSKLEVEPLSAFRGWVDIFIYPGYRFKIVDAMITNFHLPKSTLLMLVSAFAGKKNIDKAYKYAIKNNYRFYSYGDAMFIS